MKYLSFLFLVTAVHGYGLGRVRRETNVPAPHIRRIIAKDNGGFLVQWDPVKSDGEPVLGYKLKVKEIKEGVDRYNTAKNNETKGDKCFDEILTPLINGVFKSDINVIDIKGADNTEALFNGAKKGTWYDLRVVAYTKSKESEESTPDRLRINSSKTEADKKEDMIPVDPSLDEERLIDINIPCWK